MKIDATQTNDGDPLDNMMNVPRKKTIRSGQSNRMSNGDRIRAMSDEQLADMLIKRLEAEYCTHDCDIEQSCPNCIVAWLKQEAGEGE